MPTLRADPARTPAPLPGRPVTARGVGAVLELVRWPNAVIAAAGVLLGALWAGRVAGATWLAAVAALALTAVANAFNDVCDREIDRIAHPARPLPRDALGVRTAIAVAGGAALVAPLAAAAASPALGALSCAVVLAMFAYSRWLKRFGLSANLLAAVLASLPFLYGAWSVGRPARAVPLVALAVPLHFAREVAKDLDDAAGDAATRRTLPLVAGPRVARATVVAALLAFVLCALVFFARRTAPSLVLIAGAVSCVALAARRTAVGGAGGPALLKGAMLFAMAAAAADAALRGA